MVSYRTPSDLRFCTIGDCTLIVFILVVYFPNCVTHLSPRPIHFFCHYLGFPWRLFGFLFVWHDTLWRPNLSSYHMMVISFPLSHTPWMARIVLLCRIQNIHYFFQDIFFSPSSAHERWLECRTWCSRCIEWKGDARNSAKMTSPERLVGFSRNGSWARNQPTRMVVCLIFVPLACWPSARRLRKIRNNVRMWLSKMQICWLCSTYAQV